MALQSRMPPRIGPDEKFLALILDPREKFLRLDRRDILERLGIVDFSYLRGEGVT